MLNLNLSKLTIVLILAACISCSDDNEPDNPFPEDESILADVTFTIDDNGKDTRALPPGEGILVPGTSEVDKVRILTFRRQSGSSGSFTYDILNDATVDCALENNILVARGKIKKYRGYEYKIIALGYSVARGEQNNFSLGTLDKNTTLESLPVSIKYVDGDSDIKMSSLNEKFWNGKTITSPELFYGFCHTGNENPIIYFDSSNKLTGTLYRGLAKVTVTITNITDGTWKFYWFTLMAETVNTQSKLSTYDDFKSPFTPVVGNSYKWTVLDKQNVVNGQVKLSAFILPTTTKLLIRMKSTLTLEAASQRDNYLIYVENTSSAEGATGIITPSAQDNTFFLRRNQLYQISGTYATLKGHGQYK